MSDYPEAINHFHDTIMSLAGINSIESSVDNLEPIDSELLKLSVDNLEQH